MLRLLHSLRTSHADTACTGIATLFAPRFPPQRRNALRELYALRTSSRRGAAGYLARALVGFWTRSRRSRKMPPADVSI